MFWVWVALKTVFWLPLRIIAPLVGLLPWFFVVVVIGAWAQGDTVWAAGFAVLAGVCAQARWIVWRALP